MVFAPGQRVRAADLNRLGQLVGRNQRTTNSGLITTTETAIISVRAPVIAGRSYLITHKTEAFWTTASAAAEVRLRYTTNDIEPTITSTQITRVEVPPGSAAGIPVAGSTDVVFDSVATGFLRVLVTLVRAAGTGSVSVGGAAGGPMTLFVFDAGDTIAASGTVY